jgi:biopolymer transport protein ExbD
LKVNLPAGTSTEIDPSQASLVIELAMDRTYVQGKAMSDADLDKLFRVAYTRDKRTQVILKADKGTQHGRVVEIMERAKTAGLTRLAIGTASAP